MAQKVVAIIPARLGSTRFSGKVLYQHEGKPLLFYVHRNISRSKLIDRLAIATDSAEIRRAAEQFGAEVVKTSKRHRTGSDRAAEAARKLGGDIIINVQADTFGLSGTVLDSVIARMNADRSIKFATLVRRIDRDDELFDPDKVKVVLDREDNALWFSRFPIPYLQKADNGTRAAQHPFWLHIGVYFFRSSALQTYTSWRRGTAEKAESLEQLRILENGGKIRVFKTKIKSFSVDSPKDLHIMRKL
jgi:3-deoxy-manno-octulosonate cytidylyltransferase (CMP-KDO synthetase)